MTYGRFKQIFAEEGIADERIVRMHWLMTLSKMDAKNLEEKKLRWSIKTYILGKNDIGECP